MGIGSRILATFACIVSLGCVSACSDDDAAPGSSGGSAGSAGTGGSSAAGGGGSSGSGATGANGGSTSGGSAGTGGASSCSDGEQNQDETGVDCGGPCPACQGGSQITKPPENGERFYVSLDGEDSAARDGRAPATAFRTLRYALGRVSEGEGNTIEVGAGTFVEDGRVDVPVGVHVIGAGIDQTIFKVKSSYYFPTFGFHQEKFFFFLKGGGTGNNILSGFSLDGDGKQVHGGIFVGDRDAIWIEKVKVVNMYFSSIWLLGSKNSRITGCHLENSSNGTAAWAAGNLSVAGLDTVDIDDNYIDEADGYGIKRLGTPGDMTRVSIRNNYITVNPQGTWQTPSGGSAPNISIEVHGEGVSRDNEIAYNYIDCTASMVHSTPEGFEGVSWRLHHNTFDSTHRAGGGGYPIEVSMKNLEIDHNFIQGGGAWGIVDWTTQPAHSPAGLHIHDNFIQQQGGNEVMRSQNLGFHDVKFVNNTVELVKDVPVMLFSANAQNVSSNVEIANNLFLASAPVRLAISDAGGSASSGFIAKNNVVSGASFSPSTMPGVQTENNVTGSPDGETTWILPAYGGGTQEVVVKRVGTSAGAQ